MKGWKLILLLLVLAAGLAIGAGISMLFTTAAMPRSNDCDHATDILNRTQTFD